VKIFKILTKDQYAKYQEQKEMMIKMAEQRRKGGSYRPAAGQQTQQQR